jgi:hypothetical protein
MALTNSEIQKAYRQRKKNARKAAIDQVKLFADTSAFQSFLQSDEDAKEYLYLIDANFGVSGQDVPLLETMSVDNIDPVLGMESICEFAEHLVCIWRENAQMLASTINKYKVAKLENELRELESRDLSTPAAKAKAFEDAAELKSLIKTLKGETRVRFAAIAVKGGKAV